MRRGRSKDRAEGSAARPGLFWLGTGIGLLLSTAAVVITAEFIHRRKLRLATLGPGFQQDEHDLVQDLSDAVHDGLDVLSHAAQSIGHTFSEARRELIRFGLDSGGLGGAGAQEWYFDDDDEHVRSPRTVDSPDYEERWEDAAGSPPPA
jgi:hypothetical protein